MLKCACSVPPTVTAIIIILIGNNFVILTYFSSYFLSSVFDSLLAILETLAPIVPATFPAVSTVTFVFS